MKMTSKTVLMCSAAPLAATLLTLPVLATPMADADNPDFVVHKYVVHYSPSALSSAAGRNDLRRRIARAARIVCQDDPWASPGIRNILDYDRCVREATDKALARVQGRAR